MKSKVQQIKYGWLLLALIPFLGCENDPKDFQEASYNKNPEVFIDGFSSSLGYGAFSGSVLTAFQVDNEVTYNNSSASMRFDVPSVNDPEGTYAGGVFLTSVPRDLSGYDALTFWAKATQAATIDVVGFGNDFGLNKYQATLNGLPISTTWKKYIIPLPDPSKLKAEKGMLLVSEGPENGNGYSFWMDNVQFEKLGTLAHGQASILEGANKTETSFNGVQTTISGLKYTVNMPNGINQSMVISPGYLDFSSSNPAVASVDASGNVTTNGAGTTVITAKLGGEAAAGSLTLNSFGVFNHAPTPTRNPSTVISIFSEAYSNVPVNYYNGYYQPYQTTQSADFEVEGDRVLNYTNFNFVGIEFSAPTIDASNMSHLHVDLFLPNPIVAGTTFKINVVDFGANAAFGGGDDTNHVTTFTPPTITAQNWVGLNIPLSSLTGLASKTHLAQIIFEGTNISNFYADNIYFYNDGSVIPAVPTSAAPTPTTAAADVISIFSDAYSNVAGSDYNPNWGQATVTTQVSIAGNNTLRYAGLNYQGLQFGSPQNVTGKNFLHLDYYTANSTSLKVYLISPGPVEKAVVLTVPSTGGWRSIDIPLSSFSPVNLSNLIQMKFDGNGTIYLDNIYFRN
ncbi:MAG: glycosyl hydrolase family 16 [Bacteroidetes bacterium]|nr:glycosyl hydrolase family 16 [Bacteroidota bacterium]